jgi:carboxyl-terminal processing protease
MRVDQAVRLIRGEKGTVVTLEIFREGELDFLEFDVIRDNIKIPTVKTEIIDDVFVLNLYSFNAVAEEQVYRALLEYRMKGFDKLVVDVRGNPGGYLQGAVGIASFFMPAGKVVVQEQFGEEDRNEKLRTRGNQIQDFSKDRLVVLMDNGSASASEILAGALHDHDTATLIGTKSFGKGSVQELINLDDGSALKVTIARWLTPNGVSISDNGLEPDILIKRTPQQRLDGEDPQLDAAVRFLSGEEVPSETFEDQLTGDESTGE